MTPFASLDAWISAEFRRLGEIIQDYDPYLELRWIPPENRTEETDRARPFCIWDTRTNYPVFYFSEIESPVSVLAKLFDIDNKHGDVVARMDARNAAIKVMRLKEEMDKMEEANDFAAFVIKNEKSRWKHEGKTYNEEFKEDKEAKPRIIS